jgi:hypothetical protein
MLHHNRRPHRNLRAVDRRLIQHCEEAPLRASLAGSASAHSQKDVGYDASLDLRVFGEVENGTVNL